MRGFEPGDRVRGGRADQSGTCQLWPLLHLHLQQGGQHGVERQLHGAAHLARDKQAVWERVAVHGCSQQCSFWRPMPWYKFCTFVCVPFLTFEYHGTDTTHLFNLVHFRHVEVCGSALHMRPRTDSDPSHNSKASSTLAPRPVRNSVTILDT